MTRTLALAASLSATLFACSSSVVTSTTSGASGTTTTGGGGAGGAGTGGGGAGGGVVDVPCACPDPVLGWTTLGGYVRWRDTVSVDACATLTVKREMLMGGKPGEPDRVCQHVVAPCESAEPIGVDALAQALGQPDVKAALDKAAQTGTEPQYGRDDRPTDGVLLRVTVGAASFLVGNACWEGDASCTPIPAGVEAMRQRLAVFDQEVEQSAECMAILAGKKP